MCLNYPVCVLVGRAATPFVGSYIIPDRIVLNDIKVDTILGPFSASHIMMIVHNNPSTSSSSSNKFSPSRQPNYRPDFYKSHRKWISYLMWPNKTSLPKINSAEFKINYYGGSCYRRTRKEKDEASHTDAKQNWPFPAVTNNCSHLAGKRTAPCGSLPALSLHQTLITSKTLWLRSHRGKLIPADTNMAWAVMLSACYFFFSPLPPFLHKRSCAMHTFISMMLLALIERLLSECYLGTY